tara:strand:+ start:2389 stop:2823 length:435 start_codon:yes stop_codon:yes gene_type:complete
VSNLISYKSKFDKKTNVYLVDNTFHGYETLKDKFKTHGLGFAIPEKKSVFIDLEKIANDNLTDHHITFIESHEIAHIKLKHSNNFSKEQEAEADYVGVLLCKKHKENSAMNIGIKNFKSRNKISFEIYHTENYNKIIKTLKIVT